MKLTDVNFGVSHLRDGTPVLTPFAWIGKVYEFSQPLYERFLLSMKVTIGLGLATLAIAGFRYLYGALSGAHAWEFFSVALILWDYLRIVVAYIVFFPGHAIKVTPRRDYAPVVIEILRLTCIPVLVICLFLESLMALGLLRDLVTGRTEYAALAPFLILIHGSTYVTFAMPGVGER